MGHGNDLSQEKWILEIIQNIIKKSSIFLDFFFLLGKSKNKHSVVWRK